MKQKETNKSKSTHSFYKEAKNSFLGENAFSFKKIKKTSLKLFKWALYIFLVVTTLWGCVNNFIYNTSQSIGQGLEFYLSYDNVSASIYSSEQEYTYSVHGTKNYDDEDGNTMPYLTNTGEDVQELKPLYFQTINPNYGATEIEETADVNVEDLIIPLFEVTDAQGNKRTRSYSYQASISDVSGFINDVLRFSTVSTESTMDSQKNISLNGRFVPQAVFPEGLWKTKESSGADEEEFIIDTWAEFYKEIGLFVETDPETGEEYILTNGSFAIPNPLDDTCNGNDSLYECDWIVVEKLNTSDSDWDNKTNDEKIKIIQHQTMFITNFFSFLLGEPLTTETVQVTITNDEGEEELKSLVALAEEILIAEDLINNGSSVGDIIDEDYTGNFDPLFNEDYYNGEDYTQWEKTEGNKNGTNTSLVGGASYYIYQAEKGFPLIPSVETLDYIKDNRPENWYDLETNSAQGTDPRTQNAGWAMLDENGDLIEVQNSDDEDDTQYLYASQRTLDEGYYTSEDIISDPSAGDDVFDEKIENLSNGDYTTEYNSGINLSFGTEENGYRIKIMNNEATFTGITQINELGLYSLSPGSTTPEQQTGTLSTYSCEGETNECNKNSKLSASIASSGQDGTNASRLIFSSWSDWGMAWSPEFGPFYGMFVFPLAMVALTVQSFLPYAILGAWSVIFGVLIIVFVLRGFAALLSFKSNKNQQKMQEVQMQVAKINAKYDIYGKENKQMKQKKQMETMALYKKNGINPLASFGTMFLTLPIFLSMWTIISALPVYKAAAIGNFSFAVSAFYGMFNMGGGMFMLYLLVGITVGLTQGISGKIPNWLSQKRKGIKNIDEATKKAMKKKNKTQNIMVGVFIFIGLTIPTLLAIYWIFSGLFSITQTLISHFWQVHKSKKVRKEATTKT